jgi:NAD(P)H-dependent FMN reductase
METYFIPVILGTARENRQSEKVAEFIHSHIEADKRFTTELIDVRDYVEDPETIAPWVDDERAVPWQNIAKRADGYFIVAPEYNHGYPGELKILLDYALEEYNRKPTAIAGVSAGTFGGTRMVENLWQVTLELGMTPVMNPLYFGKIKKSFEDGKPKDEKTIEFTDKLLDNLHWYTKTLKQGREELGEE